jgi:hypothetical protein
VGGRLAAPPVAPKPEPEYQMASRLLAAEEHRCWGPPEVPRAEQERSERLERPEGLEQKRRHRWSPSWKPWQRDE